MISGKNIFPHAVEILMTLKRH